jgi:hypothetical protein
VLISGSVEGDVTGTAAVVVGETGRVIGDVLAPRIGVSEGAHIQGSVRTEGSSTPSSASRSVARAVAEPRSVAAAPVERPRPVAVAAPSSPISAVPSAPRPPLQKKAPPPPVIPAPRPGVRARKKLARR